jgi:lysophospholipase L1-like esterase
MRKKSINFILLFFLLVSIIIDVLLILQNIESYRENRKSRIDPSNEIFFHESNKILRGLPGNKTKVVLFGDSRINQWEPLPSLPGCKIINRGIPGDTTPRSLLRIENDLVSLNPDFVIVELGINDLNSIGFLPEMENYIIKNCKNNIAQMIDILNKKKIKTLFLTIYPVSTVPFYRLPFWSEKTRIYIKEMNDYLLQQNSQYVKILNCDEIFLKDDKMKKEYAMDMLHLNRNAYIRLNDFISPYLDINKK